jgi:excisionase family DNA binding protein
VIHVTVHDKAHEGRSLQPRAPLQVRAPLTPTEVKVLLTIDEAAKAMSVGRTLLYDLLMRKEIASIKVGRVRRVPRAAIDEYIHRQLMATGAA